MKPETETCLAVVFVNKKCINNVHDNLVGRVWKCLQNKATKPILWNGTIVDWAENEINKTPRNLDEKWERASIKLFDYFIFKYFFYVCVSYKYLLIQIPII